LGTREEETGMGMIPRAVGRMVFESVLAANRIMGTPNAATATLRGMGDVLGGGAEGGAIGKFLEDEGQSRKEMLEELRALNANLQNLGGEVVQATRQGAATAALVGTHSE
jgi:hypothetical protein